MSRELTFATGTIVTAGFLNDRQEIESALALGVRLEKASSTIVRVPVAVDGSNTGQTSLSIAQATGGVSFMRYITAPVTLDLTGNGANTYDIYAIAGGGPGFTLQAVTTGSAAPASSRKIGEVDWSGSAINAIRQKVDAVSGHGFLHGATQADALLTAAPTTALGNGVANAAGSADSYARSDHTHAIAPGGITGTELASTLTIGGAQTVGQVPLTARGVAGQTANVFNINLNGTISGGFTSEGVLDLSNVGGAASAAAAAQQLGDKLSLYNAGTTTRYGLGIQTSKLVLYAASGASVVVRAAPASGAGSSGSDVFTVAASTGNTVISGTLQAGNTTIGTLSAGAATLSSTLAVAGAVTLTAAGTALNVTNNVVIGGTLNVTGSTTLGTVNAGAITATSINAGSITSSSSGAIDLGAASGTFLSSAAATGDKIQLFGNASATGAYGIGIQTNRWVAYMPAGASFAIRVGTGTGNVSSGTDVITLSAAGAIAAASMALTGNATVGGTLGITGATTAAAITASGQVQANGAGTGLSVANNANISGTLTVGGTSTHTGSAAFNGGLTTTTLSATGTSTVAALAASGQISSTAAGTGLAITNNATIGGTLAVTGALTADGGMSFLAGDNISFATTTGTQIGTGTTQKLAFYGSTAVAQIASPTQAVLAIATNGAGGIPSALTAASTLNDVIAVVSRLHNSLQTLGLLGTGGTWAT